MCGLFPGHLLPGAGGGSLCRHQRVLGGDADVARAVGTEVEHRLEVIDSAVDVGHSYVGTASATTTV